MKYAIVGAGARHKMFRDALTGPFAGGNALAALCDSNAHRLALSAAQVAAETGCAPRTYAAEAFDDMLAIEKPDVVIVCTPDHLHDRFVTASLDAGCDVITEKPMTIDMNRLAAILSAQAHSGRRVTVTFNYRYSPARTQLKDILMSGAIGSITAVDFTWYLDRVHGADYFRRWHRYKDRSGGLLVHKSTHHFDLLNWWVGSTPQTVVARGKRAFYRPETADALGLSARGHRCLDCGVAADCAFALDLQAHPALRALYLEAEADDGYLRDRCVFSEDIGIEDTMQVGVRYANGADLNYTLIAYSPWEGYEVTFHGTKGELRHRHVEVHGIFGGQRQTADETLETTLHVAGKPVERLPVWTGEGAHGGGDRVMLGYLFDGPNMPVDRYDRAASQDMGAWSILCGIAANTSIATGQVVDVDDLLRAHRIALRRPADFPSLRSPRLPAAAG